MPVEINPKKIIGAWDEGYSLDQHTIESRLVGYNAYGHAEFSTKRSPLGELLFRLKYRSDRQCIDPIVETAIQFLESWDISPAILIPVPASNTARRDQPVVEIAKCLSKQSAIPLCLDCVKKTKKTSQAKDVVDFSERMNALAGAFEVDAQKAAAKRILLFDDLYQSGSTLNTITRLLKKEGRARAVYALTLTRTRSS